eukprot:scaffold66792_cov57-Phaeocystis_antarctica.AAC.3
MLRRKPRGGVAAGRPLGDGAGRLPGDCHRGRQRVRARALAGRRHARRHRAAQRRRGTTKTPRSQQPRAATTRPRGQAHPLAQGCPVGLRGEPSPLGCRRGGCGGALVPAQSLSRVSPIIFAPFAPVR